MSRGDLNAAVQRNYHRTLHFTTSTPPHHHHHHHHTPNPASPDIAIVCRDASMMSMRRLMEAARKKGIGLEAMQKELLENKEALNTAVTQGDFLAALKKVNKSVGQGDLAKYVEWMEEFGSA